MAKRAPSKIPLIPAQYNAFSDPVPARPSYPLLADAKQHALATEGRNLGMTVGLCVDSPAFGSTDTYIFNIRVPPGVQYMLLKVMLAGTGTITIDSTHNGSVAKVLGTDAWPQGEAPGGGKVYSSSAMKGNNKTSALKVRSSIAWDWSYETVTLLFEPGTSANLPGGGGVLHGVAFEPIWEPQTV